MSENHLPEYPVDWDTGDLLYNVKRGQMVRWIPNEPFWAELGYRGYRRGSSAVIFYFKDINGRDWHMGMADFDVMVQLADMHEGVVEGNWKVRKRGHVYGLEWLGNPIEDM